MYEGSVVYYIWHRVHGPGHHDEVLSITSRDHTTATTTTRLTDHVQGTTFQVQLPTIPPVVVGRDADDVKKHTKRCSRTLYPLDAVCNHLELDFSEKFVISKQKCEHCTSPGSVCREGGCCECSGRVGDIYRSMYMTRTCVQFNAPASKFKPWTELQVLALKVCANWEHTRVPNGTCCQGSQNVVSRIEAVNKTFRDGEFATEEAASESIRGAKAALVHPNPNDQERPAQATPEVSGSDSVDSQDRRAGSQIKKLPFFAKFQKFTKSRAAKQKKK